MNSSKSPADITDPCSGPAALPRPRRPPPPLPLREAAADPGRAGTTWGGRCCRCGAPARAAGPAAGTPGRRSAAGLLAGCCCCCCCWRAGEGPWGRDLCGDGPPLRGTADGAAALAVAAGRAGLAALRRAPAGLCRQGAGGDSCQIQLCLGKAAEGRFIYVRRGFALNLPAGRYRPCEYAPRHGP